MYGFVDRPGYESANADVHATLIDAPFGGSRFDLYMHSQESARNSEVLTYFL